jgi:DNA invertase Pin-like site-specific DNA recombinase
VRVAHSYIRFSDPKQRKGDSDRRQLEATFAWCQAHQAVLDKSLTMRDSGLSAFKGDNVSRGALGAFLDVIRRKQIAPGSVLIIEGLDRLSREEVTKALPIFMEIIAAWIMVVTLLDGREYTAESINRNPFELMFSIMEMGSAHNESVTKSIRVREAWQQKRLHAAEKPLTARCPFWLRLNRDSQQIRVRA